MEPISIGLALGSAVVMPLAKHLLDKAANPENVAKGVAWVWSAAEHFLKVRRGQASPDEPAAAPPAAPPEETSTAAPRIRTDIDDFALKLLSSQVDSLMKRVETHMGNLQHVLQQAAQYGGEEFAPIVVVNQIKLQRQSIVECLDELASLMNQVYGVQVEGVDKLKEALAAA
jgi:hypothetical protein